MITQIAAVIGFVELVFLALMLLLLFMLASA